MGNFLCNVLCNFPGITGEIGDFSYIYPAPLYYIIAGLIVECLQ